VVLFFFSFLANRKRKWKKENQKMPVARPEPAETRVIAHLDLDCFYVQGLSVCLSVCLVPPFVSHLSEETMYAGILWVLQNWDRQKWWVGDRMNFIKWVDMHSFCWA
jgi:hypothetical protein